MIAMKALTLHQPYAALVAIGIKTIETRSWSTRYRGPLAIHAAKRYPPAWRVPPYFVEHLADHKRAFLSTFNPLHTVCPLEFGAVVATCTLADVLPIHQWGCGCVHDGTYLLIAPTRMQRGEIVGLFDIHGRGTTHPGWSYSQRLLDRGHPRQQAPWGDFRCGRYGWLLDDIQPVDPPVPVAHGRQQLWEWTP